MSLMINNKGNINFGIFTNYELTLKFLLGYMNDIIRIIITRAGLDW